ncbi:thiol-disulfide oxidoreductase DCC family protein [Motilimonas eburnea]|uniref:thiol-disulfide oxidoreductase DCC family protein n=1 Tax=Motilimonas eburnea TaxID=1737488 RepID=UPI001E5BE3E0|nr:DUF393 domain-containing protein [Motilimonas eburnea]MCE2570917.1 DUF393 domain-containing protein [Motilimonas eburnea]
MTAKNVAELTIFYDALCPLCKREMKHIKQRDHLNKVALVDINQIDFEQRYPHICRQKANDILHGQTASGEILLGLDVTHQAWSLIGYGKWVSLLRKPLIKPVADKAYLLFAKHRYNISLLLTGKKRLEYQACNDNTCSTKIR